MKKHILTIDDEADIRDLLQQILARQGYRVSGAANAVEAQNIVAADPPDLVLCDLQMEDTDGLVLIQQLKGALPKAPVILLTGVIFDPEVVQDTLGNMISAYVPKTAPLQQVLQEVRRLLGEA